ALKESDDVRGLFNHDPSQLLGRTSSNTMRLSVDQRGLRYDIDVPDTRIGNDVVESIKRGDLSGSSFAFTVDTVEWQERDGMHIREIRGVHLYDTGPVTYPAYEATS
ncbi:MAG: HK97 family phage prohead protease, partial [Planctomycetales bacterium]|nr:HK97 family phage prohead protease [Planctomycetales bacterium]